MAPRPSAADTDRELERLTARLEEAEETLEAIRSGEVDALVVRGAAGEQVYTLKGAEEPYRLIVERMQEGAVTLTRDGTILYGNRHLADLLGVPLEQLVGRSLANFVAPDQLSAFQAGLEQAADGVARLETALLRPGGGTVPMLASMTSLPVDGVSGTAVILTDLSDQRRAKESAAAERYMRSVLEQLTDAVVVCDVAGRITSLSAPAEHLAGGQAVGRRFGDAFPLAADSPDTAQALGDAPPAEAAVEAAVGGRQLRGLEVRLAAADTRAGHFLLSAGPLLDGPRTIGCVVALTDISARKRAEEQHHVLLAELNHRVKNNLAVVRSVATQTLNSSSSLQAFKHAFDGRLGALALAHNILTQTGWQKADLAQLIQQVVAPYRGLANVEDILVAGEPVLLPPQFVMPLAIVFHELATNAAKYGALSAKSGRVEVTWRTVCREETVFVELTWRELNGPPVRKPERQGFGSTLIKRTVSYEFDGEVSLDYRPEGFACGMRFPLRTDPSALLEQAARMADAVS